VLTGVSRAVKPATHDSFKTTRGLNCPGSRRGRFLQNLTILDALNTGKLFNNLHAHFGLGGRRRNLLVPFRGRTWCPIGDERRTRLTCTVDDIKGCSPAHAHRTWKKTHSADSSYKNNNDPAYRFWEYTTPEVLAIDSGTPVTTNPRKYARRRSTSQSDDGFHYWRRPRAHSQNKSSTVFPSRTPSRGSRGCLWT